MKSSLWLCNLQFVAGLETLYIVLSEMPQLPPISRVLSTDLAFLVLPSMPSLLCNIPYRVYVYLVDHPMVDEYSSGASLGNWSADPLTSSCGQSTSPSQACSRKFLSTTYVRYSTHEHSTFKSLEITTQRPSVISAIKRSVRVPEFTSHDLHSVFSPTGLNRTMVEEPGFRSSRVVSISGLARSSYSPRRRSIRILQVLIAWFEQDRLQAVD
ncbi:hypothetical protein K474DRAFT_475189 [Panus rudis PR-1116 ss-1]|nr:hypothetical protein K474DRAFT_475189 [Panus rudis PR-1116 ss-1]